MPSFKKLEWKKLPSNPQKREGRKGSRKKGSTISTKREESSSPEAGRMGTLTKETSFVKGRSPQIKKGKKISSRKACRSLQAGVALTNEDSREKRGPYRGDRICRKNN